MRKEGWSDEPLILVTEDARDGLIVKVERIDFWPSGSVLQDPPTRAVVETEDEEENEDEEG